MFPLIPVLLNLVPRDFQFYSLLHTGLGVPNNKLNCDASASRDASISGYGSVFSDSNVSSDASDGNVSIDTSVPRPRP